MSDVAWGRWAVILASLAVAIMGHPLAAGTLLLGMELGGAIERTDWRDTNGK